MEKNKKEIKYIRIGIGMAYTGPKIVEKIPQKTPRQINVRIKIFSSLMI
ncbi:MAG: hypothetical protein QXX38_01990 [Candidatus Aenigmatarchaeota archaeon]